ncbi:MAG: hypothetical protein ACYDDQ_07135 [Vulcanimicrobiaceae bacterium]
MRRYLHVFFAAAALALAACSQGFSTGGSMPGNVLPPNGAASPATLSAAQASPPVSASASPGASSDVAVDPLADAASGLACPKLGEYTCTLRFNVPDATPAPSPGASTPPTPSPSPSPSASPNGGGGFVTTAPSGNPSPTASPAPDTLTITLAALPKDAPAMVRAPKNALHIMALMQVGLTPSADFQLDGNASVQFTLPKEQIDGRAFALQLFAEKTVKGKHTYSAIWTFVKSERRHNTLSFAFRPPKMTVDKGTTYILVLYASDVPSTPSPSPPASPSPAPTATAGS